MNKFLPALILSSLFVTPAFADKPEWAGKGKPDEMQKEAHQQAMEAKQDMDDDMDAMKEKKDKEMKKHKKDMDEKMSGMEKQKEMKSTQVQKEMDKGSEQGKEARAEHSKKWWKFWE